MPSTTRTDALKFTCPFCNATIGSKCIGNKGKKRLSVHMERYNLAVAKNKTEGKNGSNT